MLTETGSEHTDSVGPTTRCLVIGGEEAGNSAHIVVSVNRNFNCAYTMRAFLQQELSSG